MTRRTLALRKETLVELTASDLRGVVGATHLVCPDPTHGGTSCDRCPTVPINECVNQVTTAIGTIAIDSNGC